MKIRKSGNLSAWLVTVLLAVFPVVLPAQLTWVTNNGAITITGCSSANTNASITIPSATNGFPVVNIGAQAFQNHYELTNVTILNGVTNIGKSAFSGCHRLLTVSLPGTLVSLDFGAFNQCVALTNLTLPNGLLSIGCEAFWNDWGVANLIIPGSVDTLTNSFTCSGSLTILDGVQNIGDFAFYCVASTCLTVPGSVTNIGTAGFAGDWLLRSVSLTNGLISLGADAFDGEYYLTNIVIPRTVTSIGDEAFADCPNLTQAVVLAGGSLGNYTFSDCTNLVSVELSAGITNIGTNAFANCGNLPSLVIPAAVINIGPNAFEGCSGLTNLTVDPANAVYSSPNGVLLDKNQDTILQFPHAKAGDYLVPATVTNLGHWTFYGCPNLTGITIPGTANTIGGWTCYDCANLVHATIGDGITSIGPSAFALCSNLVSVTVPVSVTNFGEWAFYECTDLRQVTLPSGISSLSDYLFFGCSNLTSLIIPEGVTSIGYYAFSYCSSLDSIVIPDSVTNISDFTFYGSGLTSIYFEGNPPAADTNAFGTFSGTVYYLPGNTNWNAGFLGLKTMPWLPQVQGGSAGAATPASGFRFNIEWAQGQTVTVEGGTNLAGPWTPLSSLTLTNGAGSFSDPEWTNYPVRFYRIQWP